MATKSINNGGPLSAEEVKSRMARSVSEDICYISLRPLTDETRFTLITPNGQYPMLNIYGEAAMKAMNNTVPPTYHMGIDRAK